MISLLDPEYFIFEVSVEDKPLEDGWHVSLVPLLADKLTCQQVVFAR